MAINLSNLVSRVKHYRKDLHGGEHLYALQLTACKLGGLALLKVVTISIPTVVGQNVYDVTLPAPASELVAEDVVRIASVHRADGSPLREGNAVEPGSIRRTNILDVGDPSTWADRMGVLVLDPTPDKIQTLTVEVFTTPSITAEIVDMPNHATEAIVAGATYELMLIPGEGFNASLASHWANRWVKEMGNYMNLVNLGSSGTPTMHIQSPYQARTRTGNSGVGGWMIG